MTLVPMKKRCPKCHKMYDWNPDIGRMWCPKCGGLGLPGLEKEKKEKKHGNLKREKK